MARGRMLNKSVCVSVKFHELSNDTCRLLATWIISHLDKHGVYHGDPAIVKSYVFPRRDDVTVEEVDGYLREMETAGLIVRFEAKNDCWQWWPGFANNQVGLRADRETTDFPPPPSETPELANDTSGNLPDDCRKDAGKKPAEEKLSEEKLSEEKRSRSTAGAPAPAPANAFTVYEQAGGVLTKLTADQLGDLIDEYEKRRLGLPPPARGADVTGDEWVQCAIREASAAGARVSVNYVKAILDRWRREGFQAEFKKGGKRDGKGKHHRYTEEDHRRAVEEARRLAETLPPEERAFILGEESHE